MNFNIEKVKPKNRDQLINLIREAIERYGNKCDLNFIDTSDIEDMSRVFSYYDTIRFNGDISKWNVSNVINMRFLFCCSRFNGNIDNWNINPNCIMTGMFDYSEIKKHNYLPDWYNLHCN